MCVTARLSLTNLLASAAKAALACVLCSSSAGAAYAAQDGAPAAAEPAPSTPAAPAAPQAAAPSSGGLQEIVVTAQKREERLQSIPVAVTALTRANIENLQIQRFADLSGLAPNVTTLASPAGSDPTITIRGIIGENVEIGKDSGVALYLDGVYISRSTGAGFEVADLDRVEVLRGPQGTLYGRNATGGAINYITSEPKDRFYARQDVTVGSLANLRLKTRVDTGKIGAFSFSFSYLHDQRDGWIRNSAAGMTYDFSTALAGGPVTPSTRTSVSRLGGRNTEGGMVTARYAPDSLPLTIDYKFDKSSSVFTNQAQQVLLDESGLGALRSAPATYSLQNAVPMGFTTPQHLESFGHNLTATLNLSDALKFKSITGYRGFSSSFSTDTVGGGFEMSPLLNPTGDYAVLGIIDTERDRSFSEEAQVSYSSHLFDAIAGVYYFRQHTLTLNPLYFFAALPTAGTGPVPASVAPSQGDIHNQSVAGYGQGTLHISPELDLTAGVRYTRDIRQKEDIVDSSVPFEARFKHADWATNLTYRPTRSITLYAKAGTGYISGGINTAEPVPYKPEKLRQIEIGAKTEWFDHHLRFNIAGFDSQYTDLQVSVNDPNTGLYITGNAGRAKIDGVEVEIAANPVRPLTLSANYGYTHFKYQQYILNGVDVTDVANPRFYRPKHTLSLSGQYDLPELPNGAKPSLSLNARWHSNMSLYALPAVYNFKGIAPAYDAAATAALDRFADHNAMWDIDARASLAAVPMGTSKGKFSIWVRNLLDKRTITNATSVAAFGITAGQFHEPRTYGADFSIEF